MDTVWWLTFENREVKRSWIFCICVCGWREKSLESRYIFLGLSLNFLFTTVIPQQFLEMYWHMKITIYFLKEVKGILRNHLWLV